MLERTPDDRLALVLSGGGARGAYQSGVLTAIGERCGQAHPFEIVTGVSAGSINAVYLAGCREDYLSACRELSRAWMDLTLEHVFRTDAPSLVGTGARWAWTLAAGGRLAPKLKGILDTQPLREYLGSSIDYAGIQENIDAGRLWAAALSATNYTTGRTVTFVQGAPDIPMWKRAGRQSQRAKLTVEHILASSALPLIFPAIRLGDEFYGDGSIRQQSPLAPAVHLGARKILVVSVRYRQSETEAEERQIESYPAPGQIMGMLLNAVFLDSLETDMERLERINRTLRLLPASARHPDGLKEIDLLVLRPSQDLGKLSANMEKDLPRSLRRLVRTLGVQESKTPDFLSYLLFERPYIQRLVKLGYEDAVAKWNRIEEFLERP